MFLSDKEKGILLLAARESILSIFGGMGPSDINYSAYPNLQEKAGAFVTLKVSGNLRGCIGYILSPMPLFETVIDAAAQAAIHDPRFSPLTREETDKMKIEISVLTPPEKIHHYNQIEIGKHGLLVEEDNHKGLLLPQVAVEHNMNREQFLTAVCEKAWLPSFLWKEKFINIKVFKSIVFSESGDRKITYVPD